MRRKRNRRIDLIHHQMDRPTKFGDFGHGYYYSRRPYTKLTCPSPTTTGARGPRFHTNWTRGAIRHARDTLRLLAKPNGRSTSCAFAFHTHTPTCQPERTTSLQSAYTDDNGTPATWTLVLFQQAIDRQDRTQTEGRFSLLEPQEIHP